MSSLRGAPASHVVAFAASVAVALAAVQAPAADGSPAVVLGSVVAMGPHSVGYGSERPAVISMCSCANAISKIVWQDWGEPVAHGSGQGCTQSGAPPQYPLVASNIGQCQGILAFEPCRQVPTRR